MKLPEPPRAYSDYDRQQAWPHGAQIHHRLQSFKPHPIIATQTHAPATLFLLDTCSTLLPQGTFQSSPIPTLDQPAQLQSLPAFRDMLTSRPTHHSPAVHIAPIMPDNKLLEAR